MSIKCSVFIATSLDGFIARPDGDIDWLHNPTYALPDQSDMGYKAFMAAVDTLVMGRGTFEKVLTFGFWPYEDTPVVVLTSRALDLPDDLQGKVSIESGAPEEIVARLAAEGRKHLYIDGGVTIQRFLRAGLINEMTITQIPILLGDGLPLFGSLGNEKPLLLVEAQSFANGFVQTKYLIPESA